MVESWNSHTGHVSGKTWHFSTRELSGQNLQITSFWSSKEEFHLHSQENHVTFIWLNCLDDPGMQTDNSSKTYLSLWSNNAHLMCSVFCFLLFTKEEKQTWYIHARASVWIRLKSVTYKFSYYCQTDLGQNLSSNNYYKSLNFSSLSLPSCSKGSMTLLWDWNLERKAESRKKVCLESEVLPPSPPKNWGGNWNAFSHQFWHAYVFCRPLISGFFHNKIIIQDVFQLGTKAE